MAQADAGDRLADGLTITVYARVTGGGYRGALGVSRRGDANPLEWVCELPEIFSCSEVAKSAAADFASLARADGGLVRLLESWEAVHNRRARI